MRKAWYAHVKRSLPWTANVTRLPTAARAVFVGVSGAGRSVDGMIEPSAYAGLLLYPAADRPVFAVPARLVLSSRSASSASASACQNAGWRLARPPPALRHRPQRTTNRSWRLACVLAALGADRLRDGEGTAVFVAGGAASVVATVWIFVSLRPQMADLGMSAVYARQRLAMQIVPVVVVGLALITVLCRGGKAGPASRRSWCYFQGRSASLRRAALSPHHRRRPSIRSSRYSIVSRVESRNGSPCPTASYRTRPRFTVLRMYGL